MTTAEQRAIGARLKAERDRRGWGVRKTARLLRDAVDDRQKPELPSFVTYIKRWESGQTAPTDPRYRAAYARIFEVPEAVLFPSPADSGASWEGGIEDDVRRRTLLGLFATAAAAPWAQQAEHVRAELTSAMSPDPTDRDADTWERVAFDYAHEVGILPAAQLLPELLADFAEINGIITAAHGKLRTRMIHTAAQLAALTAITLTNLGDPRGARRWWRTAGRAADESGDHFVASLVRGRQAVFSLYEGRPTLSVLDLAEEAVMAGQGQPCAGVASGHAARAQALAQLGRHSEAAAALDDLKATFERLPDRTRDDRTSQWGWSLQRLHHVASHVHTFAGDVERAGSAQDQALALYPARSYQGPAQIELHRAGCLLAAGDIDEGARHVVRILERLPAEHRGDGLLRRTAATTLSLAPLAAVNRPPLREAYELLTLTPGDR